MTNDQPAGGPKVLFLSALQIYPAYSGGHFRSYGLANALQDFWFEQLVKRGTTSVTIPSLIRPAASWAWAAMIFVAALICLTALRVARVVHPRGGAR